MALLDFFLSRKRTPPVSPKSAYKLLLLSVVVAMLNRIIYRS